jgi:squalene-hopene/tetraprenyl-beta-curcumene cyclase
MNDVAAQLQPDNTLDRMIARASEALLDCQHTDGRWVFELEADATIPAEYVLLVHYLGETPNLALERKIGVYLRRIQGTHGGWPLFHDGAADTSATIKAYFALKMIGDSPDAPHMAHARALILEKGGALKANVFTRFLLALYGETEWHNVPTVPAELILLPRWFPIHLSKMSYWARTVIVPLLVLQALKPVARNPRGVHVSELFVPGAAPAQSRAPHQSRAWSAFFTALDKALKLLDPLWPKGLRKRAIDKCVAFVTERLNGEDGLGAIYPAIANSVMMYDVLGYPQDHSDRAVARKAVELGYRARLPRAHGSRRRATRKPHHARARLAQAAPGAERQRRLGAGAPECAPGWLGVSIQQRLLSRSR